MRIRFTICFVFIQIFIIMNCMRQPNEPESRVFFQLNFKLEDQSGSRWSQSQPTTVGNDYLSLNKSAHVVTEDVLMFHFDEDSGTVVHDATPYRHEGSISGAEWIESPNGSALRFNGESYVTVPDESSLNPTHFLAVSARFNLDNYAQSGEQAIVDKLSNDGVLDQGYTLGINDGKLFFRVTHTGRIWPVIDDQVLENNQWYLAQGVFDGSQLKLLLDGQEKAALEMRGPLSYSNLPLLIGAGSADSPADYGDFFSGIIDEVRIRTGIEYEDFDIIRVVVIDLSKFTSLSEYQYSALAQEFEREWLNFRDRVREPLWEDHINLWSNFFRIVSNQNLEIKGAFAEGTIVGVEGLNRIEVAAMRAGRIIYRGTAVAYGQKGNTTSVKVVLE